MLQLNIVDGKTVVATNVGPVKRVGSFLWAPFGLAWRHNDLIAVILQRELAERFKGSVAGWIWALVAPLLALITYTLMFSHAATMPDQSAASSQFDYALFIFGGLIAFNLFAEMAYRAPSLLHEYSHYIKQTMFPIELLPVISTLRASVYASIGVALMLTFQLVITGTLHWTVLLLPFWIVTFIAFLLGFTWLFSALGAFSRDISYFMLTIVPLMLFLTPVFFSNKILPPPLDLLIYINVLTGFIETERDLVVFGRIPNGLVCGWTCFVSAAIFWYGYWFFGRARDGIADVI